MQALSIHEHTYIEAKNNGSAGKCQTEGASAVVSMESSRKLCVRVEPYEASILHSLELGSSKKEEGTIFMKDRAEDIKFQIGIGVEKRDETANPELFETSSALRPAGAQDAGVDRLDNHDTPENPYQTPVSYQYPITSCIARNSTLGLLHELTERTRAREVFRTKWAAVSKAFLAEVAIHKSSRMNQQKTNKSMSDRVKQAPKDSIHLDLEDFYRKFDIVLDELMDRMELIELQEFQQLVIHDLSDRCQAVQTFRGRLELVQRELMQKFVIDELIEDGLLSSENPSADKFDNEEDFDWVSVQDSTRSTWEETLDDSEWLICEF